MADKITNFEDYKKKDVSQDTEIDIQIEDPCNFFNEEEREEYYKERQKDSTRDTAENAPVQEQKVQPEPERVSHEDHIRRRRHYEEVQDYEDDQDYEDEDYEEDYEDEEESEGGFPIELLVRISSIITGILILAFLAIVAKVKIYDRYFAPDPDQEKTAVEALALPAGYTEKAGTVVVTAVSLNLRSVDNSQSDATVVTSVPKGTELKRIAVNADGSWALVEYNGSQVYASMKYLSEKTD